MSINRSWFSIRKAAAFPPFTFAALRFLLAAAPLLWFFPRPAMPLRALVAHGLLNGIGQFGLMLYAIAGHVNFAWKKP